MKVTGRSLKAMAVITVIAASTTACNKKKDNSPPPVKNSLLQVVHVAPNVGELSLEINGKKTQHKVQYLNAQKPYAAVQTETDALLKLILSNNSVVAEGKAGLANNGNYTLFLYDTLKSNKIKIMLLKDNLAAPGSGKTNIRFLHLSPNTGPVDVDIFKGRDSLRLVSAGTYPGDNPNTTALALFKTIASGDYRVKVKTKTGSAINTVLDIPSLKLDAQRITTLYLGGLTKGAAGNQLSLQTWQHK